MPLHVSSTCAHHQEVKIALHTYCETKILCIKLVNYTYRCDDTRGCASSWLVTEINIAPTCFGLLPSSGGLHQSLAKVIFMLKFGKKNYVEAATLPHDI